MSIQLFDAMVGGLHGLVQWSHVLAGPALIIHYQVGSNPVMGAPFWPDGPLPASATAPPRTRAPNRDCHSSLVKSCSPTPMSIVKMG
ncbi:hypothetical protein DSO57_1030349 [Entomophthora muscae]|uniref:Uncharacterized protein n=1 Tax=Entomophthora muscae TaxID=34485 RepID=A0ACC2TMU5_9FUNG|nr:hypothetical protein DSO57_1030349 [Entomophthora muscae]